MGSPPDRVVEPSRPTYPFGKPGDLGSPVAGARPTLESVKAPQLRLGIDSTCYVIEIVTGTRVVRPGPREVRLESLTAEGDGPGRSLLKPNTAFFLPCLEPGADSVIALLPVDDLDGRLGLKDRVAVGFRVNDKKRSASVTPVDATGWLASLTDQQKGIDARRPPDASVFVRGRTDRSKARGAVLLRFGEQGAVVSSVVLEAFQVEGRALTSVPAAGLRLEPEGQMRFRTSVELALPAALVEELVLLVASGSPNQFGYPQVRAHLRLRLGDSVVEQDVMVNGWVEALRRPTATPARR
jgi:hypothetical protein